MLVPLEPPRRDIRFATWQLYDQMWDERIAEMFVMLRRIEEVVEYYYYQSIRTQTAAYDLYKELIKDGKSDKEARDIVIRYNGIGGARKPDSRLPEASREFFYMADKMREAQKKPDMVLKTKNTDIMYLPNIVERLRKCGLACKNTYDLVNRTSREKQLFNAESYTNELRKYMDILQGMCRTFRISY